MSEASPLFIVDNSDENWKGLRYLVGWTEIAEALDVATRFFEIGSLLALDGKWQKLSKIRILMGDEMSARTRYINGLLRETSLEANAPDQIRRSNKA